jgi:NAD(P)-dependent dehydrogenase (short-subunit alcohol dehydrogenase family)
VTWLVTGAAGGIGAATVELLTERGEAVLAQDLDAERLGRLQGGGVERLAGDLTSRAFLDELARRCVERGVRSAVAAHGIEGTGALHSLSAEQVRRVLAINASSIPALVDALWPALTSTRGALVAVVSQAGLVGEANNTAYSASKFAIMGWLRRARGPAAASGISLRALCPGCTRTPLLMDAFARFARAEGRTVEEFERSRTAQISTGRLAEPAETAAAALYLAEPDQPRPDVLAVTGGEVLW